MTISFPTLPSIQPPELTQPAQLTQQQLDETLDRLAALLKEKNAVLIAHFYTPANIQILAERTKGCVADSLQMARFGSEQTAERLLVAGVKFMGETAKILNPEKKVLVPSIDATCSLDLSCPAGLFSTFCDKHQDRTIVVYANTSAAVKARADWVVTSSNALSIIRALSAAGEKILWASDRYLGHYIQTQTNADMLIWPGSCIVHEQFKASGIKTLKEKYKDAGVLVHPESPEDVIAMADAVGSTSQILTAAQTLPHKIFIVATDEGLFYQLQKLCPDKQFIPAPIGGHSGTCKSCARCPWMLMNTLDSIENSLLNDCDEIQLNANIIQRARIPLQRMMRFRN